MLAIKKGTITQYILIYAMLVFNGGILYPVLQSSVPTVLSIFMYLIVAIGLFSMFFNSEKYGDNYCRIMAIILFVSVVFVRFTAGGVGLSALMQYLVCIMVAFLAVCVDKDRFATRLINVVYILAAISIAGYILQLFAPDVLKSVLTSFDSTFSYNDWSAAAYGGSASSVSYKAWGLLFFTMRDGEMTRNLGIFTEPGNYQIVLNAALFVLLFLPKLYSLTPKQIRRRFFVIAVAILTCQSTSGYIIFLVLCIAFIFSNRGTDDDSMIVTRRGILYLIVGALIVLIADYFIRGAESFLNSAVISKLFEGGSLNIQASTGYWRMGSILSSLMIMLRNPLGAGYDSTLATVQSNLSGSAGGALMTFGATLGIVPFICTLVWFIRPVVRENRLQIPAKIAFIYLFLQSTLAQTSVFYPVVVSIVVLLLVTRNVDYDADERDAEKLEEYNWEQLS